MNTPGGGIWNDTKDKPETGGPSSWNVDVFVQIVKDLVSVFVCVTSLLSLLCGMLRLTMQQLGS